MTTDLSVDERRPDQQGGSAQTSRRRFSRVVVQTELIGRLENDASGKALPLSLANLSYGGGFFCSKEKVEVGDQLQLELQLGDDTATSKARVVHLSDEGFAVAFVDPPIPFTAALSRVLTRKIMENAELGSNDYDVAGRVAMLLQQGPDYEVLFTSSLNKNGVLVLTDRIWAYSETLWITLLEHGMFDCEVRVLWCTEDAMALEFINPSAEFQAAYQRVLDAFLG